jgi:hypothetical protein
MLMAPHQLVLQLFSLAVTIVASNTKAVFIIKWESFELMSGWTIVY